MVITSDKVILTATILPFLNTSTPKPQRSDHFKSLFHTLANTPIHYQHTPIQANRSQANSSNTGGSTSSIFSTLVDPSTATSPAVVPDMDLWQPWPHLLLLLQDPVVLGLSVLVLTGAQGMCHPLQTVNKGTGKVIGGVHLQRKCMDKAVRCLVASNVGV